MVEFLHPHGPQKNFKWPYNPDRCLVSVQSIISAPVTTAGQMHKISDSEFGNIVKSYEALLNTMLSVNINVKFRNMCCRVEQKFSIDMMKHVYFHFHLLFFQLKNALSSNLNFK